MSLRLSTEPPVTSAVACTPGTYLDRIFAISPPSGQDTPPVPPVAIDKLYFSCAFAAPENASADPRRTDAKTLIAFPPVKCVPEKPRPAAATCLLFPGIYAAAPSAPSGATLLRVP